MYPATSLSAFPKLLTKVKREENLSDPLQVTMVGAVWMLKGGSVETGF